MTEPNKKPKNEEKISSKDYEHLIDQYQFKTQELKLGNLVTGKVIRVTDSHILIDVGSKTEGLIPAEDFQDNPEYLKKIKPGDEIEAILEKSNLKEGYYVFSRKRAIAQKALNNLEKAFIHNNWIIGKVTQKIKNGYVVNVGIDTFLPDSHADIKIIKKPEELIGNLFKFKVIKFDRKTENAVLSRKILLLDERQKRKQQVFSKIEIGMKVKGLVRSLTNFGAFVDIGGIEGLLHISDMSWGKINHPSELFDLGQEIEVAILDINEKEDKISLGYKQLTPDPWENIEDKYQIGTIVTGKVVSLTDFGAFVELENGVEGLVHISDLSWARKLIHPKKLLSSGQEVNVSILDINAETKRISLGLKQATTHPLELLKQKFSPGSRVKGKITSITDFGAFMEVEKGVEGLIHISDISWKKIKHPSQMLKVGEETEAIILNIDVEKQKLSLGIKQLEGDIWEDFFQRQKVGDLVDVKIVRITDFGVFVEILPGIEGIVFLSELSDKKIDDPSEAFAAGEQKTAKILKLNAKDKKISLSFKQAQLELQKRDYQKYVQSQDDRHTLGDLIMSQLKNLPAAKAKQVKQTSVEPVENKAKEQKSKTAEIEKETSADKKDNLTEKTVAATQKEKKKTQEEKTKTSKKETKAPEKEKKSVRKKKEENKDINSTNKTKETKKAKEGHKSKKEKQAKKEEKDDKS
ncbi:MAG: 30S ribosomal protein S1 [Candidatus Aminicenantes bacterium]|nr:30S ribosomal protein S1 [Candidatus Aminicenantes bacterium]